MFAFYTEILKKDEQEFWILSMRRLIALFEMRDRRDKRMKQEKEKAKQQNALAQMRAL
ncbi:hypothetical protein [Lentibacillus sp. JNUCC-1]|uniref:hypothetical protein n=1 Tax=Lentibacillus sp. JNUCC-1 TaxID=2654513 RepID=UPI0012E8D07C|nr:hypothetical protein [Lentibacillus sp. JNUCC-1]